MIVVNLSLKPWIVLSYVRMCQVRPFRAHKAFSVKFLTPVPTPDHWVVSPPCPIGLAGTCRVYAVWVDLKCLFFGAAIADAVSETFKVLRQGCEAPP